MLPYYAVNRQIVVLRAKVAPLLDCTYFAKKREFELPFFRGVTFVIGDKERPGGDLAFGRKLRSYWTPVPEPAPEPKPAGVAGYHRCGK